MDFLIKKVKQKNYNATKASTDKKADNRLTDDIVVDRIFAYFRAGAPRNDKSMDTQTKI